MSGETPRQLDERRPLSILLCGYSRVETGLTPKKPDQMKSTPALHVSRESVDGILGTASVGV